MNSLGLYQSKKAPITSKILFSIHDLVQLPNGRVFFFFFAQSHFAHSSGWKQERGTFQGTSLKSLESISECAMPAFAGI